MAFQASKTSAKQTGFNVGATVVAALTNAGIVATESDAIELLFNTADAVYNDLQGLVDEDNAGGKSTNSGWKGKPSAAAAGPAVNPGDQKFTWGKHDGKSIEWVHDNDAGYLIWLTEKDTNPARTFMRKNAEAYLDSVKAGV